MVKISTEVVYFDGSGAVVEPNSPKVRGFRHEIEPYRREEEDVFSRLSPTPIKNLNLPVEKFRRK